MDYIFIIDHFSNPSEVDYGATALRTLLVHDKAASVTHQPVCCLVVSAKAPTTTNP
jgi:hypothetical protein